MQEILLSAIVYVLISGAQAGLLDSWGKGKCILQPRGPPRPQIRARADANESPLFAAIVVLTTSSGWPSVVTSNMLRPAPSSRLLNLTGFFSGRIGFLVMARDIFNMTLMRGPDQGMRVLLRRVLRKGERKLLLFLRAWDGLGLLRGLGTGSAQPLVSVTDDQGLCFWRFR